MQYKNKKIVAFVPIKLNSERIPKKNLKILGGKVLYRHILDILSSVKSINEVYVYCSDDSIAYNLPPNVKFLKRDKSLDSNETLGQEIYQSFINKVDADYYVLAHTTSPFIEGSNIDLSIDKVVRGGFDSAFSVRKIMNFAWYKDKPLNYSLDDIPRTQSLEPIYIETSGFFIFKKSVWSMYKQRIGVKPFKCVVNYIEGIDIDESEDFLLAQLVCERKMENE